MLMLALLSATSHMPAADTITCCAMSDDGNYIATANRDFRITVWNVAKKKSEK